MSVIRFVLALMLVVFGVAAADADQERVWRGRDNEVLAQGTLIDVQGDAITIFDTGRQRKMSISFKSLADEDQRYVALAVDIARRFGEDVEMPPSHSAQDRTPSSPEQQQHPADSQPATVPESPVVAVRLNIAPQLIQSFCIAGDDNRRIVVQQTTPDAITRIVCYDGANGDVLSELQLPKEVLGIDVSPSGDLVAVQRRGPVAQSNRKDMYWGEVYSLTDGVMLWKTPDELHAGTSPSTFCFLDDQTIVDAYGGGNTGRVWNIHAQERPFGALLKRLTNFWLSLAREWNALRSVQIDLDIFAPVQQWLQRSPMREWKLSYQRLALAHTPKGVVTLVVGTADLRPFDLSSGSAADKWTFPLGNCRLEGQLLGVDSSTGAVAFVVCGTRYNSHELVIVAKDGSLIARQPIRHQVELGSFSQCVPLGAGHWACVARLREPEDDMWAKRMTINVFDQNRGEFIWTYTLDRSMTATRAHGQLFWWAMPDPKSLARTIVIGMPLPEPRALHFSNWAVTTEEPVLSAGASVTCFARIDKRALKELTSADRNQAGKGIPAVLGDLELVEVPDGDLSIFHEIVSQDRGGEAGIYNVIAGISIFDREQRLLCRSIRVCSPEDRYGFCADPKKAPADWHRTSERLWKMASESFRYAQGERTARGLGDPKGIGSGSLNFSPETLTKMATWTPCPAELVNPLTDLAEK